MKSSCSPGVPKSLDLADGSEFILGAVFSRAAGAPVETRRQATRSSSVRDPKPRTLEPRYAGIADALFFELLREGERSSLLEGTAYCLLAGSLFLLVAIGLM